MARLYIICGFLGAGKTTFSKQLAQETGAEYLNADDLTMSLYPASEYESNWEQCFLAATEKLWERVKECAENNKDAILDCGFWTKKERDEARSRATQLGMGPVVYFISVPDDIAKQRIALRPGNIAQNNIANYDQIKKQFMAPEEPEDFILIQNFAKI